MEKEEFIKKCSSCFEKAGMSDGSWSVFYTVGDDPDVNTTVFIDKEGFIFLTKENSVIRVKTSINVADIVDFRFDQFGQEETERFFIICKDFTGLDFCRDTIGFFKNGEVGRFRDAFLWFSLYAAG